MKPNNRGLTIIELIVSVLLLGMIVIGMFSIDIFSRDQFISSDKRVKLQNEAAYVLSHMSKQLASAIGDVGVPPIGRFSLLMLQVILLLWRRK